MVILEMKTIKISLSSILFLLSVVACSENRAEVFPLDGLSYVEEMETYSKDKFKIRNEYFVVSNMPDDRQNIKKIVEKYNSDT